MKDRYYFKLFIIDEKGKPVYRICPVLHPQNNPEDKLGYFLTTRKISEEYILDEVYDMKDEIIEIEKEIKDKAKKFNKTKIVKPTKQIEVGTKMPKKRISKKGDINDFNYRWGK